jgi:hypothetical protein
LTDWVTVALSGGSVCVGAGLTMLGQYLSDRRVWIRDREARREEFRVKNFEIQRDSLLELQEVVIGVADSVRSIVMKAKFSGVIGPGEITHWYGMRRPLEEAALKWAESRDLMGEAESTDELPEPRRGDVAAQFEKLSAEFTDLAEQANRLFQRWDELIGLANRIRILSARTGDQAVIARSGGLLEALDSWSDAQNAEESEKCGNVVAEIAEHALTAISNALRNGPLVS